MPLSHGSSRRRDRSCLAVKCPYGLNALCEGANDSYRGVNDLLNLNRIIKQIPHVSESRITIITCTSDPAERRDGSHVHVGSSSEAPARELVKR